MAKFLQVLALIAFSIQISFAKPSDQQLSNLSKTVKDLAEEISNTLGLEKLDSEKILKTINDQSKAVSDNLQTIVDKLKSEAKAHQPEVDNVIKSVEEKLAKTADDLKKTLDPKAKKQLEETKAKFDDGVKNAAAELDKLVKSIQDNKQVQDAQANIKKVTKSALDSFLDSIKTAEAQLKKAIADHEKTHKH